MHFSACLVVALGSLASAAVKSDPLPYETMDLTKRQNDPSYQCHADCGGSIRLAREGAQDNKYCKDPNWESRFKACLKCGLKYDNIWERGYGEKVKEAAQKCGLEAVPEPGNDESAFEPEEELAPPRPVNGKSKSEPEEELAPPRPVNGKSKSEPEEERTPPRPFDGQSAFESEEDAVIPGPFSGESAFEPEEERAPPRSFDRESAFESEEEPAVPRPFNNEAASKTDILGALNSAPATTTAPAIMPPSRRPWQSSRLDVALDSDSTEPRLAPTSIGTTARPATSTLGATQPGEANATITSTITPRPSSQGSQTIVSGVAVAVLALLATWSLV
ncbi:hypothetical protein CDD81_5202 [Ophiocordyceps australis]|uniref:Stc1 domain-containing protein n=1 Tax=Ophiocordyceps australis TaxID=1399860 RepID=A0A2C5XV40_9HYPO|nr:hypothetical protein CDD81_5202 [Ophiocordyceps australis]